MTIEASIYSRCTTHAGLSALISDRCYSQRLPDSVALPAVAYHLISTPPHAYNDHDASPPDRWRYRVQFDVYADSPDERASVRKQLWSAWQGWHSGTAVGWAWVHNVIDDFDTGLNKDRAIVEVVIDAAA
jgi:hypothetical protein